MEPVPHPKQNVVGTNWVFRNKQDEHNVVTRNKARLVAKGYACDTPVSLRASLKMPNQEPPFYENQSKHEHQINLRMKISLSIYLEVS
jgi:hypothetical protein